MASVAVFETLELVAPYLRASDLATLRLVSRDTEKAAARQLWRRVCVYSNSQRPSGRHRIVFPGRTVEQLAAELVIPYSAFIAVEESLMSRLERLEMRCTVREAASVMKIVQQTSRKLRDLVVDNIEPWRTLDLSGINTPSTILAIVNVADRPSPEIAPSWFLEDHMPRLKRLAIRLTPDECALEYIDRLPRSIEMLEMSVAVYSPIHQLNNSPTRKPNRGGQYLDMRRIRHALHRLEALRRLKFHTSLVYVGNKQVDWVPPKVTHLQASDVALAVLPKTTLARLRVLQIEQSHTRWPFFLNNLYTPELEHFSIRNKVPFEFNEEEDADILGLVCEYIARCPSIEELHVSGFGYDQVASMMIFVKDTLRVLVAVDIPKEQEDDEDYGLEAGDPLEDLVIQCTDLQFVLIAVDQDKPFRSVSDLFMQWCPGLKHIYLNTEDHRHGDSGESWVTPVSDSYMDHTLVHCDLGTVFSAISGHVYKIDLNNVVY
ncbi:hypothetical protein TRVA0_015S01222 [Trichomonascus vanleenenianus]|uniref:uncharacterized protein n=1 Tax=Trichomonascus vanleenenianus TaxID=2268995 RepID=UPI003ECA7920